MYITVITVVYNSVDYIENTILSVIGQGADAFEYIVIDGASKDGTTDIISSYSESIDVYVSEPDDGIYDAMNKALSLARGTHVCFMNAGDQFNSLDVLTNTIEFYKAAPSADVYVGDTRFYNNVRAVDPNVVSPASLSLSRGCMDFCHQSAFSAIKLHRKFPFDDHLRLAADYKFFMQSKMSGAKFLKLPFVVSDVLRGGVSDLDRFAVISEYLVVNRQFGSAVRARKVYVFQFLYQSFSSLVKKILGESRVNKMAKLKRWF